MTPDIRNLIDEAMKLPPEARAALADCLMQSLDDGLDEDVARAWDAEVAQRVRELNEGLVKPIPWSEARRIITS